LLGTALAGAGCGRPPGRARAPRVTALMRASGWGAAGAGHCPPGGLPCSREAPRGFAVRAVSVGCHQLCGPALFAACAAPCTRCGRGVPAGGCGSKAAHLRERARRRATYHCLAGRGAPPVRIEGCLRMQAPAWAAARCGLQE